MTETYADLERKYDGPIPRDEIDRADGIDVALAEARGAVLFWRERVDNANAALGSWILSDRPPADRLPQIKIAREWLAESEAALARAEARLRLVQDPATAATKAVLDMIERPRP